MIDTKKHVLLTPGEPKKINLFFMIRKKIINNIFVEFKNQTYYATISINNGEVILTGQGVGLYEAMLNLNKQVMKNNFEL